MFGFKNLTGAELLESPTSLLLNITLCKEQAHVHRPNSPADANQHTCHSAREGDGWQPPARILRTVRKMASPHFEAGSSGTAMFRYRLPAVSCIKHLLQVQRTVQKRSTVILLARRTVQPSGTSINMLRMAALVCSGIHSTSIQACLMCRDVIQKVAAVQSGRTKRLCEAEHCKPPQCER